MNLYHHFRTSTSWCRSEFYDGMTLRHDIIQTQNNNIFEIIKPQNYRNKKKTVTFLSIPQAEISSASFLTPWHDVMTWRHHANTKQTTFFNSATQNMIETKKIIFSSTSTSWVKWYWIWHAFFINSPTTVTCIWYIQKIVNKKGTGSVGRMWQGGLLCQSSVRFHLPRIHYICTQLCNNHNNKRRNFTKSSKL